MPPRKKSNNDVQTDKIPTGLSRDEFLKYYRSHRSAFRLDDGAPRHRSTPGRTASATEKPAGKKRKRRGDIGSQPGNRGKTTGLRVIGGNFKGLRLEYGGDHRVRPMKDRIRESVFNLMGTYAEGRHVIDLFSGTGALAFEALSRGAVSATLIEIHFSTARIIRRNIARLEEKAPEIAKRIDLKTTDVFFWGKEFAEKIAEADTPDSAATRFGLPTIPWLVFCSPPYEFFISRQKEILELLATLRRVAHPKSIFVIEADSRFDFDLLEAEIPEKKRRTYPPAEIGIFINNGNTKDHSEPL
ncbi:MAG: RsmD family RNA methyltransferase [Thermoguttaceae bacterium]|jgi:16S rRNA (guanine966-N2)-methyltransferase